MGKTLENWPHDKGCRSYRNGKGWTLSESLKTLVLNKQQYKAFGI